MSIEMREHIALAPYTLYKIGGPARYFIEARTADEMQEAIAEAAARNSAFFILGAGSNTLIADEGFQGLVIRASGGGTYVDGNRLRVDAGVMMARAVLASAQAGLTGFEWGIGVPGTVGGSVRGNAGCFGGEMKDVVESVAVFHAATGEARTIPASECRFGYRDSIFKTKPDWVILSATLSLPRGDIEAIRMEIRRISEERTRKQDIGTKSCGCIFKNTPWERSAKTKEDLTEQFPGLAAFENSSVIPSSYLIDQCGLKGTRVGGACISPKHANFFVNEGTASAKDVMRLIGMAKDAVKEQFGLDLREEIRLLGF